MSKISQEFINNLGFLYEEIHVRDQDFLNEESEYYDVESAELTEDIILSIALSMFSEGYNAETFIKFLAHSDEEVILERYLSSDITLISEQIISDDFIEEQLELLEFAGLIRLLGRGAGAIAKGARAGASAAKTAVKTGVQKAATAGVERRVGAQFTKSGNASRAAAAVEKLAKSKAAKSGVTVPTGSLSPKQSTDLLKQARIARATRGVKTAAMGALAAGTGVLTGYAGAKLGGAGQGAPKPTPSDVQTPSTPSTPSSQAPSTPSSQAPSTPSTKPSATGDVNKKYQELRTKDPEAAKKYGLEQWAKANPKLAAKVNADGTQKGNGQSQMEKDAEELRRMTNRSKQRQGKLMGGPEGPGKIDTKSVDDSIKAETERLKKSAEKKANEKVATTKESYDAYDIVLEYLINSDQVKTLEEAHYVMLEMDSQTIGNIVRSNKI